MVSAILSYQEYFLCWQSGITEEVRDLIRNVKHAENIDEWNRGYGIGNPIEAKTWWPNWDEDIDDDQHFDMKYFPHKGKIFSNSNMLISTLV